MPCINAECYATGLELTAEIMRLREALRCLRRAGNDLWTRLRAGSTRQTTTCRRA